MAISYTQLLQLVQDFCENTETSFVANIPFFVKSAEQRILHSVQLPALRKNALGSMTASNQYLSTPTDFLAPFSLAIMTSGVVQAFLLNKDVEYIREAFPDPTATGTPSHYALFDADSIILGPTPDTGYSTELHYFYMPESIVIAGTSWLGTNFESALLYGTLREANLYLKGEADMVANYEKQFQEALMLLKGLGDGKARRDSYRNVQNRLQVP
jgi:hypothetical protein